jgi:1-acyl-sn-glycerol-3-phosphate acyltransferase
MFYWLIKGIAWPLRILYFRISAEGVEHLPARGAAIVISNHSSYLDAGVLGSILPRKVHFIVLSSMYARWRLRWFYWGMDTIPVRRDRADPAAIRRALQVLTDGGVLGVFPEGGRSPDGRLQPPMLGAALIAARAGVWVVPAGISGAYEAFPPGRFWPRPRRIRVRFGKPFRFVEPERGRLSRGDIEAFGARMMSAIAALLGDTTTAAPRRRAEERV